ncbi:MAG: energy transducer TonB [Alphaproteobacteria bacterium]|nr:energy transducer TonB [Alphaproteobacteria bacterium]
MPGLLFASALAFAAPVAPPTLAVAVPSQIVRQVSPQWPESVVRAGASDVACEVVVVVDPDGVPTSTTVSECPEAFVEATGTAVAQWRWDVLPYEVPRRVTLRVRFPGLPEVVAFAPRA